MFQLSDGVILKTSLQTKFYPSKETTHCQWGQELHCLELQCKVPDGHNYVDVEKQKIFWATHTYTIVAFCPFDFFREMLAGLNYRYRVLAVFASGSDGGKWVNNHSKFGVLMKVLSPLKRDTMGLPVSNLKERRRNLQSACNKRLMMSSQTEIRLAQSWEYYFESQVKL